MPQAFSPVHQSYLEDTSLHLLSPLSSDRYLHFQKVSSLQLSGYCFEWGCSNSLLCYPQCWCWWNALRIGFHSAPHWPSAGSTCRLFASSPLLFGWSRLESSPFRLASMHFRAFPHAFWFEVLEGIRFALWDSSSLPCYGLYAGGTTYLNSNYSKNQPTAHQIAGSPTLKFTDLINIIKINCKRDAWIANDRHHPRHHLHHCLHLHAQVLHQQPTQLPYLQPSQDDLPHAAAYLLQCDGAIPICLRNRRGGSCLGEKCMCGHSFDGNFHGTTQPYYLKKKDLGKNC